MFRPYEEFPDRIIADLRREYFPHTPAEHLAFLEALPERRVPIPARLSIGPVRKLIMRDPRFDGGIRTHHAQAIRVLEKGQNPVLTTGTGSGKSMTFFVEALNTVLTHKNARVSIIYPTQALNADQQRKWQEVLEMMGLPENFVAKIDGTVLPAERIRLLSKARIVLTTPDTWHRWFMGNVGSEAAIIDFIANLRLQVLEEAQLYSGAFGTSAMFLLRRIEMMQRWLNPEYNSKIHGRMIATSATLPNAPRFLKQLTGRDFVEVGENTNGAARHQKLIGFKPMNHDDIVEFCKSISQEHLDKKILVFADNRKYVEELVKDIGERAMPYKSGMSGEFQKQLLDWFDGDEKNITVATSAMEIGVDRTFDIGINIGLPGNVARAHQRIGRIGRHRPGFFMFIGASSELADYGDKLSGYLNSEFPEPILYPDNQFIQMSQAMCLKRERKMLSDLMNRNRDGEKTILRYSGVKWPKGFNDSMKNINEDTKKWPWHFRTLVPPAGMNPHSYHTLRNVGGGSWRLASREMGKLRNLGSVGAAHAFHEFPPGAIVLHQGHRWRVRKWTGDKHGPYIQLQLYKGENTTRHSLVMFGQSTASKDNLISTVIMSGKKDDEFDPPFIGECRFRFTMGLYSFVETYKNKEGQYRSARVTYQDDEDLAKKEPEDFKESIFDYGPKRRMLIDTTGVVIHMPRLRFGKDAREKLGAVLIEKYCDIYGVDHGDLGFISTRCRFIDREGTVRDSGNMAIFDRTAGSLRLSKHFPRVMKSLTQRIIREQKSLPENAFGQPYIRGAHRDTYLLSTAEWFLEELRSMDIKRVGALDAKIAEAAQKIEKLDTTLPEGFIRVMAPASRAEWINNNVGQRIRILESRVIEERIYYEVLGVDRYAFYSRVRASRTEIGDAFGFESDARPFFSPQAGKLEISRVVPADDIALTIGRWVGFNPETKKYIELGDNESYKDISVAIEEQMQAMRDKIAAMKARAEANKLFGRRKHGRPKKVTTPAPQAAVAP